MFFGVNEVSRVFTLISHGENLNQIMSKNNFAALG